MKTKRPGQNELEGMSSQDLVNYLVNDPSWGSLYRGEARRRAAWLFCDPYTALMKRSDEPTKLSIVKTEKDLIPKHSKKTVATPHEVAYWAKFALLPSFDNDGWKDKMHDPDFAREFIIDLTTGYVSRDQLEKLFPYVWKWYEKFAHNYVSPPEWLIKFRKAA